MSAADFALMSWISCKDRLPTNGQWIFFIEDHVYGSYGDPKRVHRYYYAGQYVTYREGHAMSSADACFLEGPDQQVHHFEEVTYWLPMPKPPAAAEVPK